MAAKPNVIALPSDAKAPRARRLAAEWAEEDRLEQQLRELRVRIRPLQGQVSRDFGYPYTIGREKLERAMKAKAA